MLGEQRIVVIHHPADDDIRKTLRDHVRPPFTDAPYTWWSEYPDGAIVQGRSILKRGAHVIPDYPEWAWVNNETSVGFAFEGNFDDERPPIGPSPDQLEVGAAFIGYWLAERKIAPASIDDLARVWDTRGGVIPHRLVSRTACPGRHFMKVWDEFIGKVRWYYTEALS